MTISRSPTLSAGIRGRGAAGPLAIFDILIGAVRTWYQRRTDRAAFNTLLSLDDHMLDDVGVTRWEVERAARLPMRVDAAQAVQAWRRGGRLPD